MNSHQKTAIEFIYKITGGKMDVSVLGGREYRDHRRAIIAMMTGELPSQSHCSLADVENSIKQVLNIVEMADNARIDFLKRVHKRIVDEKAS